MANQSNNKAVRTDFDEFGPTGDGDDWPEKKPSKLGNFLFLFFVTVIFGGLAVFVLYTYFPGMWEALMHAKWYSLVLAVFSIWMYSRGESLFS